MLPIILPILNSILVSAHAADAFSLDAILLASTAVAVQMS